MILQWKVIMKKKFNMNPHNPTNRKEPYCQCLHEIENKLPRTIHCFMPCRAQREITGYNIKAKETVYKGINFKSQLEARWAIYFDELGLEWVYEPDTYKINEHLRYTPDFYLKKADLYVEIKPIIQFWDSTKDVLLKFSNHIKKDVVMCHGTPTALPMPAIHYFSKEYHQDENLLEGAKKTYDYIITDNNSKYGGYFICGGDEDFTQDEPYFQAFMKASNPELFLIDKTKL